MKNHMKLFSLLAIVAFLTVKCSKDDDNNNISTSSKQVDASVDKVWKYFSFEKGDTVQITDPKNSLDWDIAFMRSKIKTNGGLSGKGSAGVFDSKLIGQGGFDALTLVPDSAIFIKDDSVTNYGANGAITKEVLNIVLNNWYSYNEANQGKLPSKNNIYVVRTAKNNYAKLWIQSYYNDEGKSGHFTIAFKYQPNSSKKLE